MADSENLLEIEARLRAAYEAWEMDLWERESEDYFKGKKNPPVDFQTYRKFIHDATKSQDSFQKTLNKIQNPNFKPNNVEELALEYAFAILDFKGIL